MSTSAAAAAPTPSKGLHYGLWVVQGLLGAMFLMAGTMKLLTPPDELVAQGMAWAGRFPFVFVKFVGAAEALGAVGLILPSALRILPKLTAAAAAGLVLTMIVAAGDHARSGELGNVPVNVVLGGLALFVAWGRAAGAPIEGR